MVIALALFVSHEIGRRDLVSRSRRAAMHALRPPPQPPERPTETVRGSPAYAEVNRLVNRELLRRYREAPLWKPLLQATDSGTRAPVYRALRDALIERFQPWPGPTLPLEPTAEPWFSRDGVQATLVRIQTHSDVRLTAALLIPDSTTTASPALIVLHGTDGDLHSVVTDDDYHHGFAMDLARRGFVVLAPLLVASTPLTAGTLLIKSTAVGWRADAIMLWQLVRGVDFLQSLGQVDSGRIGVYGVSLGGRLALQLGALDSRLSLVLASGTFADRFTWMFTDRLTPPTEETILDSLPVVRAINTFHDMGPLLDIRNEAALIHPRFLGLATGTRDPRIASARALFEDVERLYGTTGDADRVSFLSFDGAHETSVESAMPFLLLWARAPVQANPRE
jgi:hypothetical protein